MSWGRWAGLVMVKDKHGQGEGTRGGQLKHVRGGVFFSVFFLHLSSLPCGYALIKQGGGAGLGMCQQVEN